MTPGLCEQRRPAAFPQKYCSKFGRCYSKWYLDSLEPSVNISALTGPVLSFSFFYVEYLNLMLDHRYTLQHL